MNDTINNMGNRHQDYDDESLLDVAKQDYHDKRLLDVAKQDYDDDSLVDVEKQDYDDKSLLDAEKQDDDDDSLVDVEKQEYDDESLVSIGNSLTSHKEPIAIDADNITINSSGNFSYNSQDTYKSNKKSISVDIDNTLNINNIFSDPSKLNVTSKNDSEVVPPEWDDKSLVSYPGDNSHNADTRKKNDSEVVPPEWDDKSLVYYPGNQSHNANTYVSTHNSSGIFRIISTIANNVTPEYSSSVPVAPSLAHSNKDYSKILPSLISEKPIAIDTDDISINSSGNFSCNSQETYKSNKKSIAINKNNITINSGDRSHNTNKYVSKHNSSSKNTNTRKKNEREVDPSECDDNSLVSYPDDRSHNANKYVSKHNSSSKNTNTRKKNEREEVPPPPHRNEDHSKILHNLISENPISPNEPYYNVDKKKVIIDVAVLCQEYTNVETICDDNIVNLDEISIKKKEFQSIFYPYSDNFGINKDYMNTNSDLISLISFLPEHRSLNTFKKRFYLLDELITNIERNLNVSRNCFTKESLVELTNEIIGIKSLLDINCCSVLASLSWKNVLEVIENYKLVHCENDTSLKEGDNVIIPICVVNIVFKTPTPDVKNTVIRFNYKIIDY